MSHRIIVLDEAEDELVAAQRWYETQHAGLGQEFRKAIDEYWTASQRHRLRFTNLQSFNNSETRRMIVKRFPYSIIFVEYNEDLWVIAFTHNRRRPGYWRERLIP